MDSQMASSTVISGYEFSHLRIIVVKSVLLDVFSARE